MQSKHDTHVPFEIVFNDEYIVVVNKIAKIVVVPTPKKERHTLTSLLADAIKEKVYPCHRLDRETSGLIVYAKSPTLQQAFTQQFKKGKVFKKYYAFVKGIPPKRKGFLDEYVLDKQGARFKEKPKRAKSFYRVIKQYRYFSMLELEPLTGRTHQLRIQLAHLGNPVLGEQIYAYRKDFTHVNCKRLALHAYYISFIHPVSAKRVELAIDLAKDLKSFLQEKI